jgi:subtilisin family serine protease
MKKIFLLTLFIISALNARDENIPDEPYYFAQWYINYNKNFYIHNKIAKNAGIHTTDKLLHQYSGKGVTIAIIDDDLDASHEDLKGAIFKIYPKNLMNKHILVSNHGTAVAGIIAARKNTKGIQGIAYNSKIIFLQHPKNMTPDDTIVLFDKAVKMGADIINCSWMSIAVSQKVRKKIKDLAINARNGKGLIIVFASGNGNQPNILNESSIPEVISVGATNKYNKRAWYSNFGKNLDIVAPGGNSIGFPTLNGVDGKYLSYKKPNTFSGTSAAAALVSGVIALMLEKDPELTRIEVENILKMSADKIGKYPYINGKNDYYGYGKINLVKIMKYNRKGNKKQ